MSVSVSVSVSVTYVQRCVGSVTVCVCWVVELVGVRDGSVAGRWLGESSSERNDHITHLSHTAHALTCCNALSKPCFIC